MPSLLIRLALANAPAWTTEGLEEALRALAEQRGTTAGKIFQPLRVALTGLTVSPGIFDVLDSLGKQLALTRLDEAIAELAS